MSVAELLDFAGGDVHFDAYCRTAARVVRRKWSGFTEDELTQMIAVEAIEGSPTLVKNLHTASDPDEYLMGALIREGSRAASETAYSDAVSGVTAGKDEEMDWYEEASFGTPTGLYSTDAVRSALMSLDWPDQVDPLMDLVVENLPKLSKKDRELLVSRFVDGVKLDGAGRKDVTNAVDRLTKLVNGCGS